MEHLPPLIGSFTTGADIICPSRMIIIALLSTPSIADVTEPLYAVAVASWKRSAPSPSNCRSTAYPADSLSIAASAFLTLLPSNTIVPSANAN